MEYYAIIDGEQRGPFTLEQLPQAGVRPSTYVWCKGMPDWEKAEDVAEICRLYRGRLYDLMHPKDNAPAPMHEDALKNPEPAPPGEFNRFGRSMQDLELPTLEELEAREDFTKPPAKVLPWAILVTFFCPPFGIIAIFNSVGSIKCWKNSLKDPASFTKIMKITGRAPTPEEWRELSHEYCRSAKMWTGIAFFFGIILISFLIFKL